MKKAFFCIIIRLINKISKCVESVLQLNLLQFKSNNKIIIYLRLIYHYRRLNSRPLSIINEKKNFIFKYFQVLTTKLSRITLKKVDNHLKHGCYQSEYFKTLIEFTLLLEIFITNKTRLTRCFSKAIRQLIRRYNINYIFA